MGILNMTIFFSNSGQKLSKRGIFDPKLKDFDFRSKFSNKTSSRALTLNMTFVFKIATENTQIRHFWFQLKDFLVLEECLQVDKLEVADFKYNNNFSKTLPKTPK